MPQTTSNGQNKIKNTFVEACGHCQIKPKGVNCCENFDILSVPGCFQILQEIHEVTKISFYTAITNNNICKQVLASKDPPYFFLFFFFFSHWANISTSSQLSFRQS